MDIKATRAVLDFCRRWSTGAEVKVRTDCLVSTLGIGALADRGPIESSIPAWVPQD
jgi:hypothetical protein